MTPLAMVKTRGVGRALAGLSLAATLSACITLLPKEHPVQLYRFGATEVAGPATGAALPPFTVRAAVESFDHASAGDKLLTVTGDATAYMADARWVTSAQSLFEAAMIDRLGASGGPARVLGRTELAPADYRLDVSVRRFEVNYTSPRSAPPEVEVEIDASMDSAGASPSRREARFEARTAATENTVHAIVSAYSQSVSKVLAKLAAWVNAKGAA